MSGPSASGRLGGAVSKYSDIALALLAVTVIVLMVLPLPAWMLDALIAVNIASGIVLLLFSLYVPSPVAFSTFPSVLLFSTLFRIALNVATTRQILLHAHAGDIIDAFGRLVVGGSLIVGLVVFLIITIVQFIVIAKGAERVAEVGARFTLDAMPGKQMSIDSDLRAGVITQSEALARRRDLVVESQFFGAMDGAMKFVKGDSIAGIIIVVVNLLGGMAIGVLALDMPLAQAVQKYSVLSIGDGLVTQIPALFTAMAAGVIVTRTSPEDASSHLAGQIGSQLASQPRALLIGGVVMTLFALVPGFPVWAFLSLGAGSIAAGMLLTRQGRTQAEVQRREELFAAARDGASEPVRIVDVNALTQSQSPYQLELSPDLAARVGIPAIDAALLRARVQLRLAYGLGFPGAGVRFNSALAKDEFRVLVQGMADGVSKAPTGARLVLATPARVRDSGMVVDDVAAPSSLMPACWVTGKTSGEFQSAGFRSLDSAETIAQAVVKSIQLYASETLGVQEVRQMLREIEPTYGDLVREALSAMPLPRLTDLFSALARDRVPLTDLPVLLQAVVTHAGSASDAAALYQSIREGVARGTVARLMSEDGKLHVITLEHSLSERLIASVEKGADGPQFALSPKGTTALLLGLTNATATEAGSRATAIVVPHEIRRALARIARTRLPGLFFISEQEIAVVGVAPDIAATVGMSADVFANA